MVTLVRRDHEHRRRPWRNGQGVTAEVASSPPAADAGSDFDWRVSFADVTRSGDFSRFAGVDRVITLIDGPVLTLVSAIGVTALHPFEPFEFDGDLCITCHVAAPTRDLNVMTRRGRARAEVEVLRLGGEQHQLLTAASPLLVAVLDGNVRVLTDTVDDLLGRGDVAISDASLRLAGNGIVEVVRIAVDIEDTGVHQRAQ